MCGTFAESRAIMASTPVLQLSLRCASFETLSLIFYAYFTFEHIIAGYITRSTVGTIHSIILWEVASCISLQTFQRNLLRPSSNKPLLLILLTLQSSRLTQYVPLKRHCLPDYTDGTRFYVFSMREQKP